MGHKGMLTAATTTPIQFTFDVETFQTSMMVGKSMWGSFYRNLEDVLPPAERWKANAIVNMYHTELRTGSCNVLSNDPVFAGESKPALNLFRHGVVGFRKNGEHYLVPQLVEVLQHAAMQQKGSARPTRIVSLNLLAHDQYLTGEKSMIYRHSCTFESASCQAAELFARRWRTENRHVESVGAAPVLEVTQLFLPTNTDQKFFGSHDYDRQKNFDAFALYATWVMHDVLWFLATLLFSDARVAKLKLRSYQVQRDVFSTSPECPGGVETAASAERRAKWKRRRNEKRAEMLRTVPLGFARVFCGRICRDEKSRICAHWMRLFNRHCAPFSRAPTNALSLDPSRLQSNTGGDLENEGPGSGLGARPRTVATKQVNPSDAPELHDCDFSADTPPPPSKSISLRDALKDSAEKRQRSWVASSSPGEDRRALFTTPEMSTIQRHVSRSPSPSPQPVLSLGRARLQRSMSSERLWEPSTPSPSQLRPRTPSPVGSTARLADGDPDYHASVVHSLFAEMVVYWDGYARNLREAKPSTAAFSQTMRHLLDLLNLFLGVAKDVFTGPLSGSPGTHDTTRTRTHRRMEKCEIILNLLSVLLCAEFGGDAASIGGGVVFPRSSGRMLSRMTSLMVASVLNQALRAAVFVNCKSGIDRTGIVSAVQLGMSSLWKLYPSQRRTLHSMAINCNILRHYESINRLQQPPLPSRYFDNSQPSAMAGFDLMDDLSAWDQFCAALCTPNPGPRSASPSAPAFPPSANIDTTASVTIPGALLRPARPKLTARTSSMGNMLLNRENPRVHASRPTATGSRLAAWGSSDRPPEARCSKRLSIADHPLLADFEEVPVNNQAACDYNIDEQGVNIEYLETLFPFFCVLKNYVLAYLCEVNTKIAYASSGLRGMKYKHHAVLGGLLPFHVQTAQGEIRRLKERTTPGIKQLHALKAAMDNLTDLGTNLLVDMAKNRHS